MLPVLVTITVNGKSRLVAWAEEMTHIKDYGDARQITLSGHGQPALQLLTSEADACPAGMLSFLKSRWRQENFLEYASENYGTGKICDYTVSPSPRRQHNCAPFTPPAAARTPRKHPSHLRPAPR